MPNHWTLLLGAKHPKLITQELRGCFDAAAYVCDLAIDVLPDPKDATHARTREITRAGNIVTAIVTSKFDDRGGRIIAIRGPGAEVVRLGYKRNNWGDDSQFTADLIRLLGGAVKQSDSATRKRIELVLRETSILRDQLCRLSRKNAELAALVQSLQVEREQLEYAIEALRRELYKNRVTTSVPSKLAAAAGAIVIAIIGGLAAGVGQEAAAREFDAQAARRHPTSATITQANRVLDSCARLEALGHG